jgi:nucleoside-diphosphate-sugar epimerase
MKILLIGGTGFIGTYLYENLSTRYEVGRTYSTSFIESGIHYDVEKDLPDDIINCKYDLIINNINPLFLSYLQLVKSIEDITALCKKNNAWLINISSLSADENNKFNDSYSLKKHIADEIVLLEMKLHNYTILRFSQVFDYKGIARKSQAGLYFLIDAVKKSESISLFANSEAMMRNYIPIDLLISSINYTIEKKILGLHNIYVPSHTTSLSDIIGILAQINPFFDAETLIKKGEKTGQVYHIPPVSDHFSQWFNSVKDFKYYLSKTFHESQ